MSESLPSDASEASLRLREAALRRAQLEGDVAVLDRLVDDELVFTGPNGLIYGKSDDLDGHRRGVIRITRLDTSGQSSDDQPLSR
ncbi:MAG TPA: nuclear transport factor 2 family protein [Gemmatimonadaceae bacterium]|nr:nuclear transport factor 2 family protein [Gemmatimonadaceae bacterium]